MSWCNYHGCPSAQCACPTLEEILEKKVRMLEEENGALRDCLGGFVFACGGDGPDHEIDMLPNFVMKAKRLLGKGGSK